jgi:large subunit ribosomal protein L10
MANPRNQTSVAQLRELLADASTFFLVDYQGLSAGDMHKLRAKVRAAGGRLLVTKNTLIHVVLKEHGVEGFEATLQGPTALVLVGDDPVAPAKALTDFAKDHPKDLPAAKGGRLQGSIVGPEALAKIATLPIPRAALRAARRRAPGADVAARGRAAGPPAEPGFGDRQLRQTSARRKADGFRQDRDGGTALGPDRARARRTRGCPQGDLGRRGCRGDAGGHDDGGRRRVAKPPPSRRSRPSSPCRSSRPATRSFRSSRKCAPSRASASRRPRTWSRAAAS